MYFQPKHGETMREYLLRTIAADKPFTPQNLQQTIQTNFGVGRNDLQLVLKALEREGLIRSIEFETPPILTQKLRLYIPA